jgi:hypothetical protein
MVDRAFAARHRVEFPLPRYLPIAVRGPSGQGELDSASVTQLHLEEHWLAVARVVLRPCR